MHEKKAISSSSRFRTAIALAAAAAFVPALSANAQLVTRLQRAASINLSDQFATGSVNGDFALSVAFDGTNAYLGGFNSPTTTAGSVSVVKYSNVLTASPTAATVAGSTITANPARGYDSLTAARASTGIAGVFAGYDSGSGADSFVARYDSSSNWQTFGASINNYRASGLGIDPFANAGAPAVGAVGIGAGRRVAYDANTGSVIYAPSGATGTAGNGDIINPNPGTVASVALGFNYRAVAFDSAGNIAVQAAGGVSYGVRRKDAGNVPLPNGFANLAGTNSATTPIAVKQTAGDPAGFVGQGLGFVEGIGSETLLAMSNRIGGTFALNLASGAPSAPPTLNGLDSRNVRVLTTSGAVPTTLANPVLTGAEDGFTGAWTGDVKNIATGVDASGNPVIFVLSYADRRLDVYSIDPQWQSAGGGLWSTSANWLGPVPDGITNATFGAGITAPSTVTLDSNRAVKAVKFDNANSYTISGTGVLTLDSSGNAVSPVLIQVDNGSHTIATNVALNDNARFVVNGAANSLTLSGDLSASGRGITKLGAGTLRVKNLRASAVVLSEGLTQIISQPGNASVSRVASISQGTGGSGTLDLTKGGLVVDYAAADPNPYADFKALASTNAGYIFSSVVASNASYAIGILDGATTDLSTLNLGVTTDASSVFMRVTLGGDANLDQTVNFDDLLKLAASYNQTGQEWGNGDFNYDGTVNFDDLLKLAANYNQSVTGSFAGDWALAQAAVPEPTSLLAVLGAGIGLTMRRRRR